MGFKKRTFQWACGNYIHFGVIYDCGLLMHASLVNITLLVEIVVYLLAYFYSRKTISLIFMVILNGVVIKLNNEIPSK